MNSRPLATLQLVPAAAVLFSASAMAQLVNYWPVNESSGSTTLNAAGGTNGTLFNGASFVTDGTRGQVLNLAGGGQYVNAGSIPAANLSTTSNYTWAFWVNSNEGASNNVIVGNRYSPTVGVDFSPREFTKFTTSQFEWHVNAAGQNTDYPDLSAGTWNHMAVVKTGPMFISYRNGVVNRTGYISAGMNNAQPLYFGGDQNTESWSGKLDDIATWSSSLPGTSVIALAKGAATPATAPLSSSGSSSTLTSDNFGSGLGAWTPTTRGLENNAAAGYNAPNTSGGTLSLSGATTSQYWYGNSVESLTNFNSNQAASVSVDRVSLTGSGTAFRSSLWIMGDDSHYLHFSQNMNEGGWTWNSNDVGGSGTLNPTGAGNNINVLDSLDGDSGLHNMKITVEPVGPAGSVNLYMYLDGNLVGAQGFTNFPSTYKVVLTGQGRAVGDSVNAVFDNFLVQIPEPGTLSILACAGLGLLRRRRSC